MSPRINPSASPARSSPRRLQFRPRIWITLACLFGLGFAAHFLWRHHAPSISRNSQYRLTFENIHITPPPPWIRTNIKGEALRDAGLDGALSVLDDWDVFSGRIKSAFELHPWVASVEQISKRLPSALYIDLKYRKPIAAVESSDALGVTFLPIDEHAVRLPEGDLTDVERRYLPRIAGVTGRPLVGDTWLDARVVGGAQLAAALADIWQQLRLVEILAHVEPNSPHGKATCSFEIVTSGGTRIVWGAAPGEEAIAKESPAEEKRQRLLKYVSQNNLLGSINGPAELDIRTDLVIKTANGKTTIDRWSRRSQIADCRAIWL